MAGRFRAAGTRGEVLNPQEALSTYLDALQSRSGGLRMLIAEGLSEMDSSEAQVALIDAVDAKRVQKNKSNFGVRHGSFEASATGNHARSISCPSSSG